MIIDLSLQQYVDWEVKPVIPIKGKFGYRVVLKYIDGTERTQQKSGFKTDKEAKGGYMQEGKKRRNLCCLFQYRV